MHTKLKPKFEALLKPDQFGLSSDGTTRAVNELAAYLEAHPQSIMLKLDFKNAFNSVLRTRILEALHQHLPQLIPIMSLLQEAVELMEKPANDSKVCGVAKAFADDWYPAGSAKKSGRFSNTFMLELQTMD